MYLVYAVQDMSEELDRVDQKQGRAKTEYMAPRGRSWPSHYEHESAMEYVHTLIELFGQGRADASN